MINFQACIDDASDRRGRAHQFVQYGFVPLSVFVVAIVVASAIVRHYVSFGSFTHYGIAKENIATERVRAEQSRTISPMKQFLVVVLPDGRVVNPRVADQL